MYPWGMRSSTFTDGVQQCFHMCVSITFSLTSIFPSRDSLEMLCPAPPQTQPCRAAWESSKGSTICGRVHCDSEVTAGATRRQARCGHSATIQCWLGNIAHSLQPALRPWPLKKHVSLGWEHAPRGLRRLPEPCQLIERECTSTSRQPL